jgi:hypothetical protein
MNHSEKKSTTQESAPLGRQADGVYCSGKVFDSKSTPLIPPQGSPAKAGSWVWTLRTESLFFMLFKGTVLFALFFCLFSLFLYAAGTRQGFTDETQIFLLRLSLNLGLVLSICSVCGIGFCLLRIFYSPHLRHILMAGAYLCLGAFGLAVSLLASFIIAASGGNV